MNIIIALISEQNIYHYIINYQESDGAFQTLRIYLEELESHKRTLKWSVQDKKEHELWEIGQFKINSEWDHYAVILNYY